MNELTTTAEKQLSIQPQPSMNLAAISERILSGELTTEKLTMIKELVAMDAERQFNAAFIELQRVIPQIRATKPVHAKDGTLKYMVAPFEEIDEQLRPLALQFGFSYSFSECPAAAPGRVAKRMTIFHVGGHSRTNDYSTRIGAGPPGCSESQADGSAHSYAKRGAMCDGFTIIVDRALEQDDARAVGPTITPAEAEQLRKRVKAIGANEAAFLKFAGAPTYEAIGEARMNDLLDMLERKEKAK